jgi:replicative DNA helicase
MANKRKADDWYKVVNKRAEDVVLNLPVDRDAERAVLGGLMMGAVHFSDVHEYLDSEDFFGEAHQTLFALLVSMIKKGEATDLVSVLHQATHQEKSEKIGGHEYITQLYTSSSTAYNIDFHASIVKDLATRRRLMQNANVIIQAAQTGLATIDDVLELAEKKVFEITQSAESKDWQSIEKVVGQEFERIQALMEISSDVTGMDTGFIDLNKILSGLQKTDLFILAARPAMGKTALALNIALNVAKEGNGVGIFSMEMSAGQLVTRLMCTEGRVDAGAVRTGKLNQDTDIPRLVDAAQELHQMPIYIDDTPGLTINQLSSKSRRLKAANPDLGLIVVDYIGLMLGDSRMSRQEQVSEASRGLKGLAKELDICVMALSQLNRSVESRTDKRPMPSDLRESGAIEQDADIISFIYRDEYYNPDSPEKGVAEVIIAKQRNGSTGTVKLFFEGKHTRFDNYTERSTDDYM